MRKFLFTAAIAAVALPGAPALAQFGGSPDQQIDGPVPPPAASARTAPQDQADADRDVDRDVDADADSDMDVDSDNRDDPYVSVEPGGPGDPSADASVSAPAARAEGYVRLRPGDHYPGGASSPYRPLVPPGPKDQDVVGQGAPDDQYDADDSDPDDSADAFGKEEGPPDQPDDEESPPAR